MKENLVFRMRTCKSQRKQENRVAIVVGCHEKAFVNHLFCCLNRLNQDFSGGSDKLGHVANLIMVL